jgi:hypothetical protein
MVTCLQLVCEVALRAQATHVSVLLTSISEFVLPKSDRLPKWPVGGVSRPKLYFVSVV